MSHDLYENERGFQGQLLIELSRRLPTGSLQGAILEQEHQKTLVRHGLTIRPDIVIHEPFDPAVHRSRKDGNVAAIELKCRASPRQASDDFENLILMLSALRYPIGIFINIGHSRTHAERVGGHSRGRIVAFSTTLTPLGVRVVQSRPR